MSNGDGNSLNVSALGATLKATGSIVVLVIVLAGGFIGLGLVIDRGLSRLQASQEKGLGAIQGSQKSILDELATIESQHFTQEYAQRDLACVFSVPQETRIRAVTDPLGACHFATGFASDMAKPERSRRAVADPRAPVRPPGPPTRLDPYPSRKYPTTGFPTTGRGGE